jgi:Zn-dependent protease with chaperone function
MLFRQHQAQAQASTTRLLLLFAAVVLGLVLAVNGALAALLLGLNNFNPFGQGLPKHFFLANTTLVLVYVLGGWWIESSRLHHGGQGAQRIAQMLGARPAQTSGNDEAARRERRYLNVVHEMALAARMPTPTAWVLPRDDAINALAAGWGDDNPDDDDHRDAAVIVTRGALERLSRAELQGVVAHELSHIDHGDTKLNMHLVGMVWGLQLIWSLGDELSAPVQGRLPAIAPLGWVLQGVGWLGWLAGRVLQAAVSRQREYLADATAVKSTRQVDGLGGALRKIADQASRRQTALASSSSGIVAHLLLASPFGDVDQRRLRRLLATHPSLPERLQRLYGREVLPLEDAVLPMPEDEPLAAVAAITARYPGMGATVPMHEPARYGAAPTMPHAHRPAAEPSEGERHDAYQKPAHFDTTAQERDAMQRISRWGGPSEWQAAMLALSHEGWSDEAWQAMTADLRVAAAVRQDLSLLGPAARRWAVQQMAQRALQSPLPARLGLWRLWARRLRTHSSSAAMLLPVMAMRHHLAPRWRMPHGSGTAWVAASVHAATRAFALTLPLPDVQRRAWWQAASRQLADFGFEPPAAVVQRGLAPGVTVRELNAALRVRRLSAMQQPLLIKAWLNAADECGAPPETHPGIGDALHWVCLGLRLPVPGRVAVATHA